MGLFSTFPNEGSLKVPCRAAVQKGARHYEFPTGFNYYFGAERLLVGEQYFVHSPQLLVSDTLAVLTLTAN